MTSKFSLNLNSSSHGDSAEIVLVFVTVAYNKSFFEIFYSSLLSSLASHIWCKNCIYTAVIKNSCEWLCPLFYLVVLSFTTRRAEAAFTLNVGGPNWDYTTRDLADTTSQACKDAYSSQIDCDDVLVGMVASLNPNFSVNTSDLDRLCTTTCSDSLSEYIKNVNAVCNQPGDLSGVCKGNKNLFQALVEAAGEVLQYQYGEACSKNGYTQFEILIENPFQSLWLFFF